MGSPKGALFNANYPYPGAFAYVLASEDGIVDSP